MDKLDSIYAIFIATTPHQLWGLLNLSLWYEHWIDNG